MELHGLVIFLGLLLFLEMPCSLTMVNSDCPLDLSQSNFTPAASICSTKEERGNCCRYINALIAVSVARYANLTSNLGVSLDSVEICLRTISATLDLYGVTRNATVFCGFGTKIPVNYDCQGRTTVNQMLQSPKFTDVEENCRVPLRLESDCRKCLNSGILYLRNLIGLAADNMTLSTCRDATFVALASQVDNVTSINIASCFFGVQGILIPPVLSPLLSPQTSPSPPVPASSPSQLSLSAPLKDKGHPYHLTLVPGIGIAITVMALVMLAVLIFLIRTKNEELDSSDTFDRTCPKVFHHPTRKLQEGPPCTFRKFSYKDTKKATNYFSTKIGEGGFGTVYKAEFEGGLVAAVKRMNKISEQAEDEFCREIELLARLHHRHLVALKGFCIEKQERFTHSRPDKSPLSWRSRIQIAIDVANALDYLHFYCDPPLCHRDIKSSNILLDENFVAKVADFGLAHASKDGSICFEPVNTDIRGTPGYMDPEYVVSQELTEKSDVYSYGVVLLELLTARRAIQDNKNLVEWSQAYMTSESPITELVDPRIGDAFDFDQLQTVVGIVRWCTRREGQARPSIKQVLRVLYECADPLHSSFVEAVEDGEYNGSGRMSSSKLHRGEGIFHSGDGRCLASSSSTSRSHCSRSFLLNSPQSPSNLPSI
nr:probable receptor-like protein kinase At1g49730 isoform X2 [Coffea arabica]